MKTLTAEEMLREQEIDSALKFNIPPMDDEEWQRFIIDDNYEAKSTISIMKAYAKHCIELDREDCKEKATVLPGGPSPQIDKDSITNREIITP